MATTNKSTIHIKYSSEMMKNYLQAKLISPQKKFEALQTPDGHALLFSVGTDGVCYLIQEESGTCTTGWSQTDLSSAQIATDFAGQRGVTCGTFDAGQSARDGSLSMGMAVSTSSGDRLYLCLGNSNLDISWANDPKWVSYPYDNPHLPTSKLEIVKIFFAETSRAEQYTVVDIVRDPSSSVKEVSRFYIDPDKRDGYYWQHHDVAIDIEVDNYDSCLGRRGRYVDGLYTAGHAGSSSQLVFSPVINVYEAGPPTPVRLNLPGGAVPSAIAATRNADLSTDLYAVSGSSLYYFSSANQDDGATGVALITHDVISGTTKLAAMYHNGLITLWGRNASDQVYYTRCLHANVSDPAAWSIPIPVLSGIEKMSPYLNAADGGNTIFAAGGVKILKITQSPRSTLWQTSQITLPIPPKQRSISFNSYTTTIQFSDAQGLPLSNTALKLRASRRSAVYINGLYYVVGSIPIDINSNSVGMLTIVESIGTLNGVTFTVSNWGGPSVTINPMDPAFKKLAALDTSDKLRAAVITNEDGSTRPLVASSASSDDVRKVASALGDLGKSYQTLGLYTGSVATLETFTPSYSPVLRLDLGNNIFTVAIGDLFKWLESGVEAIIEVIYDEASAAWHFLTTIAGKVYRAVLDTVEAVVGAVEWVFKAVKTAIEDIIKFVQFLFAWDDITRTKEVLHNLVKRFMEGQVDGIQTFQQDFDQMIGKVEDTVNQWAGIKNWSGLGPVASKSASGSASNPTKHQNSASQYLAHHFQNNAHNLSITSGAPSPSLLQSLIDDLLTALKQEGKVFDEVLGQLGQLAHDFSGLNVEDVLKRLAGILIDGVLSSVQVVVDALLRILSDVARTALKVLDAKIHIPIISDILNDIGVPDISFLDLFCWISAVGYTVVYKVVEDKAPFPDDQYTTFLKKASSLQELQQAFGQSGGPQLAAVQSSYYKNELLSLSSIPQGVKHAVFVAGHAIAGFCVLMSDFVNTFEAAEESGNEFGTISAVLGIVGGGSVGIANFLVPKDPIQNTAVSAINTVTTGIRVTSKVIFSGMLQNKFKASEGVMHKLAANDGRATGAVVDAILIIPALACTGWHFYELSQKSAGNEKTDAILEEVSNLTSYISRGAYTMAVNDKDPETKAIEIGIMAVANVAYAGLQTAEAALE